VLLPEAAHRPRPRSSPRSTRASRRSESAPCHAPARHPRRTRSAQWSVRGLPSLVCRTTAGTVTRRHRRSSRPYLRCPPFSSRPHRRSTAWAPSRDPLHLPGSRIAQPSALLTVPRAAAAATADRRCAPSPEPPPPKLRPPMRPRWA
jgi:hypothetical protein